MITVKDFLKYKLKTFLEIKSDAEAWSRWRMNKEPMDVLTYEMYVKSVGQENADSVNRLFARTQIGWYADAFWDWLTFWSRKQYQRNIDEYAIWDEAMSDRY